MIETNGVGGLIMIDVIMKRDANTRSSDIQDMHRLRYQVFKERMNWNVQAVNRMERDAYDDMDPVYILAFAEDDKLVGTWRMLPTTGPYMLRDVFPELLDGQPAPCDPRIWECSRFAVQTAGDTSRDNLAALGKATSEIFCGLVEFCLVSGIEQIITVYDLRIGRLLPRIGCAPSWRSRPHRISNRVTLAGVFDINQRVLSAIQEASGITGSVIRQFPKLEIRDAA